MTHTYAAKRLLEHGPLMWWELRAITGWEEGALRSAIARLMEYGVVVSDTAGPHRKCYRLAS